MGRSVAAVCVAVTMLVALAPASAREKQKVDTRVRAKATSPDRVTGDVEAKKPCEDGRKVKAKHVDGETGQKSPAGKVRTDRRGGFDMDPKVTPAPGDFWALVVLRSKSRTADFTYICRAVRLRISA